MIIECVFGDIRQDEITSLPEGDYELRSWKRDGNWNIYISPEILIGKYSKSSLDELFNDNEGVQSIIVVFRPISILEFQNAFPKGD